MRIKRLGKALVGSASEFPLPGLIQYLNHGLHQSDPTTNQLDVHAPEASVRLHALPDIASGQVKSLGLALSRHNHAHRDPVFPSG